MRRCGTYRWTAFAEGLIAAYCCFLIIWCSLEERSERVMSLSSGVLCCSCWCRLCKEDRPHGAAFDTALGFARGDTPHNGMLLLTPFDSVAVEGPACCSWCAIHCSEVSRWFCFLFDFMDLLFVDFLLQSFATRTSSSSTRRRPGDRID